MSFLKSKFNGWLADGTRTPYMGGGGGGGQQPTQTTAYNTNIPEYARPYVENMLQSAQKQVYNDDMTSFRGYTPYSSDVNNYFAGFSPLQQSAQQASFNLQTPGQFGVASGLAGASGLGSLGVAGQAMGTGQRFQDMATDPRATQAYMSPYMQNVVDYQKSQALRDYQIGSPMRARQAVGAGAFGGSRQAIVDAEAQRSLGSQLQGITATGSQKAFEDAQRQQQFGAQLGLQGLQTGLQGYGQMGQAASTLGSLGQQQFGAQKDIINLQNTMGREQQALEQNKINQAIQDYAIQQQYPMMQLGFLSNMLRGLPMQSQTTQLYQAQPSMLQQGIGLTGAASTLLGGKAEGGAIKMAEGGITGYKYGGAIPEAKLAGMADNLSVPQLVERLKDPALTPGEREVFQEALTAKQNTAARSSGIAAAGGGLFNTMGYAGGGILAFAGDDESLVEDKERSAFQQDLIDMFGYSGARQGRPEVPEYMKKIGAYFTKPREKTTLTPGQLDAIAAKQGVFAEGSPALSEGMPITASTAKAAPGPSTPGTMSTRPSVGSTTGIKSLEDQLKEQERLMGPNTVGQELEAKIAERLAGMDKRASQDDRAAMRKAFVEFGTKASPGGFLQGATSAIGTYGDASDAAKKVREGMDLELTKMQADIKKGQRAEKRGNLDAAGKFYENAENRQLKIAEMQNRIDTANISASATGRAGDREDKAIQQIMKEKGVGYTEALQLYKRAGLNVENTDITRQRAADAALAGDTNYLRYSMSKKPEDQAKAEQIKAQKYREYGIGAGGIGGAQTTAVGSGNLVQNKDGSFNYVPR